MPATPARALPAASGSSTLGRRGAPVRARRLAGLVAAVLVALLALLGLAGGLAAPAAAHDAMTGSTPADGATVETPPASVDLTFSQPPLAIGAEVQVTGPDGQVVNDGDLVLTDTTVSQPIAADLPAGAYAVVWRVTSSDGHPISGELSFTATAGTVPAPAPTPEPTGDATEETDAPEPSAEPSTDEAAPDDPAEESPAPDAADPGADGEASSSPLPWILGAVVLLVAAVAVWAARRRSTASGQG